MAKETKQSNKATEAATGEAVASKAPAMKCNVKFGAFPEEGSVKGVCTVTFNDMIAVKGVKVIEGSKGLFVAMPSYKSGEEYKDLVYPITKEGRQALNEAVLNAYEAQSQQASEDSALATGMSEAPEGEPMCPAQQ